MANFDSLYRAKCLGAQSMEQFYVTDTPREYHYTLYYYDQAGDLVKTLPPDAVIPNLNPTYLATVPVARHNGTDMTNGTNIESLATQYRYNTLNQVVVQQTPDAGVSHFWYDRLGRLAVSQNAKQVDSAAYSYTEYDILGRITEVGQKPQHTAMTQTISQDTTGLTEWLADLTNGALKVQITHTQYDSGYVPMSGTKVPLTGSNLRNRVAYTAVIDQENSTVPGWRAATFYSYDPHGNVDTLVQDYDSTSVMGQVTGNRFKLMIYDYDLISGKVNQVSYQPGKADAFYHQYTYDAENRLIGVSTSRDSIQWENDASYTYYRHGPLARVELGDQKLQGIDYAYTLQGWLKSINPSWIIPSGTDQYDSDGVSTPAYFERDAYKLNLNYFDDGTYTDYKPIASPSGYVQGNSLSSGAKKNLYNGNIGSQAISIRQLAIANTTTDGGPLLYNYGYDQLNRISSMDAWATTGSLQPSGTGPLGDYGERYTYDPNGNILTLKRTGDSQHPATATLSYNYRYAKTGSGSGEYTPGSAPTSGVDHLTNQLSSIGMTKTTGTLNPNELGSQSGFNYQYNEIGQLTKDNTQEISNVVWNVYGKILSLTDSTKTIIFTYDAAGNRISKTANGVTTWYVRDAQGNVMSVYTEGNSSINGGILTQSEADLYGSSRLGLLNLSLNCTSLAQVDSGSLVRGSKLFELTNHLGNVLETISDKKVQHSSNSSTVDYYVADAIGANDYYSFGMQMPGRGYQAGSTANYRYGFNGKEQDPEVKGPDEHYDYGFRIYDPRVGRFLSLDPLEKKYAWYTPYQFAGNKPVWAIDLDGLEEAESNWADWFRRWNMLFTGVDMASKGNLSLGTTLIRKSWDVSNGYRGPLADFGQAAVNSAGSTVNGEFHTITGGAWPLDPAGALTGTPTDINQDASNLGQWGAVFNPTGPFHTPGTSWVFASGDAPVTTTAPSISLNLPSFVYSSDAQSEGNSNEQKPDPQASANGGRTSGDNSIINSNDLKLGHTEKAITSSADYQKIKSLGNEELIESVLHPKRYDPVTINSRTGKLVDGNTRIYEIQRRGLNVNVPVEKYTPDDSAFPNEQEPPNK